MRRSRQECDHWNSSEKPLIVAQKGHGFPPNTCYSSLHQRWMELTGKDVRDESSILLCLHPVLFFNKAIGWSGGLRERQWDDLICSFLRERLMGSLLRLASKLMSEICGIQTKMFFQAAAGCSTITALPQQWPFGRMKWAALSFSSLFSRKDLRPR